MALKPIGQVQPVILLLVGGLEPWNFILVNHKYMVNIWKYMVNINGFL